MLKLKCYFLKDRKRKLYEQEYSLDNFYNFLRVIHINNE